MMLNRHHRRSRSLQTQEHSHVDKEILDFGSFKVKIVPLGRTNYSYFVQDTATGALAIVDPGDPMYIIKVAEEYFKTKVSAALVTHKHWDHSAGVLALVKKYPEIRVYCSKVEPAYNITDKVSEGDIITLGELKVKAMGMGVHTKGSMAFYVEGTDTPGAVFPGDTFFLGGMGAYFEGDLKAATNSISKLLSLPEDTYMFPGHEYSDTTLKFALYLQPSNKKLLDKVSWVVIRRARYMITIPSTIKEEKSYNPFVRIFDPEFCAALGVRHYLEALARLQEWRVRKRNEYRRIELKVNL